MIHTFKMYIPLNYLEVQDIQQRLGIKYSELNSYFEDYYKGINAVLMSRGKGEWHLSMVVDVIQLLGTPDIKEGMYGRFEYKIKLMLMDIFGHSLSYKNHVLTRIDYRYDVVVQNKDERQLLIDLYKKMARSYCRQTKRTGYQNKKTKEYVTYGTSVEHKSNSVKSLVYMKAEECRAKGREPAPYENDVIRFEVQVGNNRLYYLEKEKGVPRKLSEYFKHQEFLNHFELYIFPIYYTDTFYKLDEARKIITKSPLKPQNKQKLIDFLKKVSSYDLDTPLKSMTKATQKKRIATLQILQINPITIPKNYKNAPSILENPLKTCPIA
ncbi:hypothetical protein EJF36_17510 [Bacillus sp. HMF5848]|uniref:hypothetical protein n=1 Tax=Bacillus sp. HMF5848 TaxID=2495421 RepID=UPI000F793068|nr:hypothetical protein [Bacillus sp. HMF5848]RSK28520.1 hypothetical protein EJF36_17510 [Bacillus sp. HMF5848]